MISAATGLMLFRTMVKANSAVMAKLKGGIHIARIPQAEIFPYALIDLITVQPTDTKDGVSCMDYLSIQLDIYSKHQDISDPLSGYKIAAEIEQDIRNIVDGFQGDVNDINIDEIRWVTQNPAPYEEDRDVYRVSVDYSMRLNRQIL